MIKKKENLLVLSLYSLIIAFILESFGQASIILNIVVLIFLGIAILFNAEYVVLASLKKKK